MSEYRPAKGLARAIGSLVLAAGVGLTAGGCTSITASSAGPIDPLHLLPAKLGGKESDASIRKQAQSDSFPTAAQAGMD